MSGLVAKQSARPRIRQELFESSCFGDRDAPPEAGQPVVPTALVVVLRVGAFTELLDELLCEQPLDRRV